MIRNILMATVAIAAIAGSASAMNIFGSKTVGVWSNTTVTATGNSGFIGGIGQSNVTTNSNTNAGFSGKAGASSINGDLGAGFLANSKSATVGGAELSGNGVVTGGEVKQGTVYGKPVGPTYKTTDYTKTQTTDVAGGYVAKAGGATLFGGSASVTSGSTEVTMNNGMFNGVSNAHASNVTIGVGGAVSSAQTAATVGGHTTLFGN